LTRPITPVIADGLLAPATGQHGPQTKFLDPAAELDSVPWSLNLNLDLTIDSNSLSSYLKKESKIASGPWPSAVSSFIQLQFSKLDDLHIAYTEL
jgi:hypothetical protein